MRSTPRAQREAEARWRAREAILRPAIRAASGTARRIRAELVRGFLAGREINLRDLDALREPLSSLLVASHLHSRLAAQRVARGREIRFDRLTDQYATTIDRIAGQLEANPQAVRDLAAQYDEQARKTIDTLAQSLRGGMGEASAEAVRQGLTTRSALGVIRAKLDALGLNPASPRIIETIYRTQSAVAFSAGQWNGNQDPAIDDILWGYEYTTVGDDRVRPGHAALDGTRAPKDDPIWRTIFPPCGWNCRCSVIEIFEGDSLTRRKAPLEGGQADAGWGFNPGEVFRDALPDSGALVSR